MKTTPMTLLHVLLARATPKTFERALVRAGGTNHMLHAAWTPGEASAALGKLRVEVKGSSAPSYGVTIDFVRRRWSCTCPSVKRFRAKGACCKHVAGIAMAMLRDPGKFPCEEARFWPRAHMEKVHAQDAERMEGIIWHTQVPEGHVRLEGRVSASTSRAIGVMYRGRQETLWIPRRVLVGLRGARNSEGSMYLECAVPTWWLEGQREEAWRSKKRAG